jgi:hypothetical protein
MYLSNQKILKLILPRRKKANLSYLKSILPELSASNVRNICVQKASACPLGKN